MRKHTRGRRTAGILDKYVTPFQIALKFCIDYNQIRKIRKIPILPNAHLQDNYDKYMQ